MLMDNSSEDTNLNRTTETAEAVTRRLQKLLRRLASRKQVKHAIMAVERGDRSFRWIGAAGEANPGGAPMQADTPYCIASVTKLYIAAVILKLYERRRLALDESITAYLPQTLATGLHRLDGVDYTAAITVRHLLGHTSGLPDYLEERPKGGKSLVERLTEEGDMSWSIEDLAEMVRNQLTPHFPPQPTHARRQKARYSDTNYQLLIAIIEAVAAQPLQRVFADLLFRPLNLRRTWLPGYSPLEPAPEPATLWFNGQPLNLPRAMRCLGDLFSTAGDTLIFLRALTRGEVFDDPATRELMQQRWNRFGFPRDRAALRAPGWPIEYALGIMRFRLPRLFVPLRPVPAVVGHTGSTGSWLFHCPQLDLLLAGTVDQVTAGAVPYRLVPRILRIAGAIAPGV